MPSFLSRFATACLFLSSIVLTACSEQKNEPYAPRFSERPPEQVTQYLFGVHPLHNPNRLHEIFGPLVDFLNSHINGVVFKLEASRNYQSYDKKLYAGHFHFALPNPYQTVNATQHGYHIFGKMGDDQNFRGIILVRKDSAIRRVTDLKGKKVSFPAPTALAATMMPQYYLQTHGLNVQRDIKTLYVGSQESSIMNVYLGNVAAGATWPPPWRAFAKERPDLAAEVKVMWETEPLPNNGLVVRDDIPEAIVSKVASLLFSLHQNPEGQEILGRMELSRFEPADDQTYAPVRRFLLDFGQTVRPLN